MSKISRQQKSQFWDSHLESWEKMSFECNPHKESQSILQGEEWCFFPKVVGHVKLVLEVVLTKFATNIYVQFALTPFSP
jgi:hypothetical protein